MLESSAGSSSARQSYSSACWRIVPSINPVQRRLLTALGRMLLESHDEISVDLHYGLMDDEHEPAPLADFRARLRQADPGGT